MKSGKLFKVLAAVSISLLATGAQAEAVLSMSGRGTDAGPPYSGQVVLPANQDTIQLSGSDGSSSSALALTLSTGEVHVDVRSAAGNSGSNATGQASINDTIRGGKNVDSASRPSSDGRRSNRLITFSDLLPPPPPQLFSN
jgi:hypothetical protein